MMKNEMMMAAWEQIKPDSAADARMRAAVMAYQHSYLRNRGIAMKRYISLAACLVLILTACIGVRYFGTDRYYVTLESGESLVYAEGDRQSADAQIAPYPIKSRRLTQDEIERLFPDIGHHAEDDYIDAAFREETGEPVHLEGRIGGIKLIVSKNGLPLTDTVIEGVERSNMLCGVPVKTGYAYIRQNNTAVFDAEYQIGDYTFYAEKGGKVEDKYSIGKELSEFVYRMIKNGEPDFSDLRYE